MCLITAFGILEPIFFCSVIHVRKIKTIVLETMFPEGREKSKTILQVFYFTYPAVTTAFLPGDGNKGPTV